MPYMKHKAAAILLFVYFTFTSYAQSQTSEEKKADTAQVAAVADIIKIDAKKLTLQVREVAKAATNPRRGGGNSGGRQRGGGGRSRGSRGASATPQAKEYKVLVTKETAIRLYGVNIEFGDLRIGDRISVSGHPTGKKGDLEATAITREF